VRRRPPGVTRATRLAATSRRDRQVGDLTEKTIRKPIIANPDPDAAPFTSDEVMAKAFDLMGELPLVRATLGMTSEHSATDGDLVDER
jgi:hypothetical protein